MATNDPTVNITKFLGLYNREQSRRLPVGSLTVAENIDIDDSGGIIRRQGYAKVADLFNVTSAYATQDERRLFVVSNGDLLLHVGNFNFAVIYVDVGTAYIQWVEVADFIFLSTGQVIDKDNNVTTWRIPTPMEPDVALISGVLPEGQYQISTALVDALGREGGASPTWVQEVAEGSGFRITPDTPAGYTSRVYVSEANGTELYFAGETATSVEVVAATALVDPIEAAQLGSYPAPEDATVIAHYEARLWAAQPGPVSAIWFSEPYWWNLFKLQENFISVPGWVRMMVGLKEGLLIGTDDEIYVYNDSLMKVADYGVPFGKACAVDDTGKAFIWTKQGICEALPFNNLTEQKLSLAAEGSCYTDIVEQNGFSQFVVLTTEEGAADNKLLSL